MSGTESDEMAAIDALVGAFFRVFDNRDGRVANLDLLHTLLLDNAVIVKTCADGPAVYAVEAFIAPREKLLNGGELREFSEQEVEATTQVFGNIAQRWCRYRKSGTLSGQAFFAHGMKSIQLVKLDGHWKISAVAWDDERPELQLPRD